jgi:beta-glucosidase-like glycosyl hydrolase
VRAASRPVSPARAFTSTDVQPTPINATARALRSDYAAYLACGNDPDGLVMVSSAIYPALTGSSTPAVLSPEIYKTELPLATNTTPTTISDDLQAGALANEPDPGQRALEAGLDLLLYAQNAEASFDEYQSLLAAARSGGIPRARIEQAYEAVQGLKARVAGADAPSTAGNSTTNEGQGGRFEGGHGGPETLRPNR